MKNPLLPRFAAIALLLASATSGFAQIAYLQLQPDGSNQLRQMNADGSGDVAVPLPFSNVHYPTWSRDGALLAVTVPDPSRAFDKTHNVFAISSAGGGLTKLTNYQEQMNQGTLNYVLATHKAFSPDRSALVTFSLHASGPLGGGVETFPVLEIHPLPAPNNAIMLGVGSSGDHHHEGEGVDWAPDRNVLVTPLQSSTPNLSGGGTTGVTGLFLVDPSLGALLQRRVQQITFPRADTNIDAGQLWAEHDYQPKFSPNGVGVAYVRSFQLRTLFDLTNPTPWSQSLRILNLFTGVDTELIAFPPGFYVSSITWSPDGTQLAFDIGVQQISAIAIPLKQARPETNQIYVINSNGTGLVQLRGNGSSSPVFGPMINTAAPSSLGNISTRMRVGSGDNAMIGGFIITGSESKKVIIRGMGPSLGAAGVPGALSNPILELFQGNTPIAANDNWQEAPNPNEIPNGFAPGDARESVIVTTLAPGSYTAVVRGAGGETGIGVVETYDLTPGPNSKLANISTRGFVETGDNAMIGGLIVTGGSSRILLRAMGPSLANAGIGNALQDPTLQLINGNGVPVTSNDNWQEAPNTNEIPNGFTPSDGRECAIVTTLTAGNYTAVVRGANNTTGVALVEAYHLQ